MPAGTRPLVPIAAARASVLAATASLPDEEVLVDMALGRVLAEPVHAAGDVPAFANAAMDGFAVVAGPAQRRLRIVDEARAGVPATRTLGEHEAIRISTGAMLPAGAQAVVPVEHAQLDGDEVVVSSEASPGRNVRGPGEDLRAGTLALEAGTELGPGELGVLVACGRATVRCARRPRVVVVSTGSELAAPGAPLGPGQIHNSNAVTLTALAHGAGAQARAPAPVPDDRDATIDALAEVLPSADLVVVSGGVSVGEHDHVKAALAELGVEQRFWGVALKPGKPTWFGVATEPARTLVLGVPGNPVSAMVAFTLFGRPALRALQGAAPLPAREPARLAAEVERSPRREHVVRVRLMPSDDGPPLARPTGRQDSHVLSSMAGATALAFVAPGQGRLDVGTTVLVERL